MLIAYINVMTKFINKFGKEDHKAEQVETLRKLDLVLSAKDLTDAIEEVLTESVAEEVVNPVSIIRNNVKTEIAEKELKLKSIPAFRINDRMFIEGELLNLKKFEKEIEGKEDNLVLQLSAKFFSKHSKQYNV